MKHVLLIFSSLTSVLFSPGSLSTSGANSLERVNPHETESIFSIAEIDTTIKVVHTYVSLCDNKYQGIVPVPQKIGNGQDPANNLYWGCAFGISTYFKKSKEWKLLHSRKLDSIRLERLVFKHQTQPYILVADAYDGRYIERCTDDFLRSSCGALKDTLNVGNQTIGIAGNANLVAYIGHDGLMDFELRKNYQNSDGKERSVIILACYSKLYFGPYLKDARVNPLVWTTGLMAPEAYTIHNALSAYVMNAGNETIRTRAALAYQKYQKCSEKAARDLLVTGW